MKWFKHYTDASSDMKIAILEDKLGLIGYAYYFKILEFFAQKWSGYGDPVFEVKISQIRVLLRTQEKKAIEILKILHGIGLLHIDLADDCAVITIEKMKSIKDASTSKKLDNRGISLATKNHIVKRDRYECQYCLEPLSGESFNFDHFIPISKGGGNEACNIVMACDKCNKIKGSLMPEEFALSNPYTKNRIDQIRKKLFLEIDKDKEEDIELKKRKNTKKVFDRSQIVEFDLDALYNNYPRKEGKKKGLDKLGKIIKTQETYEQVQQAIKNYADSVKHNDKQFIKQFSTFVSVWEDYIEPVQVHDDMAELRAKYTGSDFEF